MQIHAIASDSGLLVDGDVNGDRTADVAILIAGVDRLTAADFIL
ncbi:hypothetical protein [Tistrella bauzanensis]|jgi:hypothetical protein